MAIVTLTIVFAVLIVTLLSCISDIRSLRIPNWHSLIILAGFFPAYFLAPPGTFSSLGQHIGAMVGMFFITYGMFALGIMGGGDSKLGTVLGLWIGLKGLVPFVFFMAVMGGGIGLLSLLIRKKKFFKDPRPDSWIERVQSGHSVVPYGVAISFGFWTALFHTGFIHNQLNEVFKIIH